MSVAAQPPSYASLSFPESPLPLASTDNTPTSKFRGAVVEDLDLPPALSITPSTPISTALAMSYDRDYSQLTVISATTRSLLGYLSVSKIKSALASKAVTENDPVSKVMNRFDRKRGVNVYEVIAPDTPLEVLERFLAKEEFAVVTDERRRFVLGVATRGDLEEFVRRRPVL